MSLQSVHGLLVFTQILSDAIVLFLNHHQCLLCFVEETMHLVSICQHLEEKNIDTLILLHDERLSSKILRKLILGRQVIYGLYYFKLSTQKAVQNNALTSFLVFSNSSKFCHDSFKSSFHSRITDTSQCPSPTNWSAIALTVPTRSWPMFCVSSANRSNLQQICANNKITTIAAIASCTKKQRKSNTPWILKIDWV